MTQKGILKWVVGMGGLLERTKLIWLPARIENLGVKGSNEGLKGG